MLVGISGAFALFLAGLSWWWFVAAVGGVAAVAPVAWFWMLRPYQKDRILTFLNPESDPLGTGWNIIQSKIAIGAGGMTGKGWGQGSQSHLDYLPEHTTDFIFAVLSEEFGWIGVATVLALYLFVIGRCLWIAAEARDGYSRLLAGALGAVVLRVRDRQRRHDLRPVAGGRRADAAAELRRHVGGVAARGTGRGDGGARAPAGARATDGDVQSRTREANPRARECVLAGMPLRIACYPPPR